MMEYDMVMGKQAGLWLVTLAMAGGCESAADKSRIEQSMTENNSLKQSVTQLTETARKDKTEIEAIKAERDQLKSQSAGDKEQNQTLQKQIMALQGELSETRKSLASAQAAMDKEKATSSLTTESLKQAENNRKTAEDAVTALRIKASEAEKATEIARLTNIELGKKIDGLMTQQMAQANELTSVKKELETLKASKNAATTKPAEIKPAEVKKPG